MTNRQETEPGVADCLQVKALCWNQNWDEVVAVQHFLCLNFCKFECVCTVLCEGLRINVLQSLWAPRNPGISFKPAVLKLHVLSMCVFAMAAV